MTHERKQLDSMIRQLILEGHFWEHDSHELNEQLQNYGIVIIEQEQHYQGLAEHEHEIAQQV